jgi:predicted phage terminase large subunit-like protein
LAEYFLLKWKYLYNYDGRVLVVRASQDVAKTVLMAQRGDLGGGNPVIAKAFGDLSKNSPLWKETSITLGCRDTNYREPSIDTCGMEQSRNGLHYDMVFLDDLCNETNYESEAAMMQARLALQAYVPVLNAWGSLIHIGTRWGNLDTTGFILELNERAVKAGEPKPWRIELHGAYKDDGSLFYPAFLTEKRLRSKRTKMEDKLYSSQYLNKVVADESQVFNEAWLRYYDGDYEPEDMEPATLSVWNDEQNPPLYAGSTFAVNAAIVIDPAATATAASNATGMAFFLTDPEGALWVHDSWKGREAPAQVLERIVQWCVRYRPRRLSIDTLGQQVLWIDRIQDKLLAAGVTGVQVMLHKGKAIKFNGVEMKASRGILSKASRIESMQPWFREGRIFLRRGHCEAIVHEYKFYTGPTHHEHYDMLDALAQAPVVSVKPMPEKYGEDLEAREMAEELDAFPDERERRKGVGNSTGREARRSSAVV